MLFGRSSNLDPEKSQYLLRVIHSIDTLSMDLDLNGWVRHVKIYKGSPTEFLSEGALALAKKQASMPGAQIRVAKVKITEVTDG